MNYKKVYYICKMNNCQQYKLPIAIVTALTGLKTGYISENFTAAGFNFK